MSLHECFLSAGERGLRLSGSLWELCLIAACVVNYEVHFQRAVQIALWGTAARAKAEEKTTRRSTIKAQQHILIAEIF